MRDEGRNAADRSRDGEQASAAAAYNSARDVSSGKSWDSWSDSEDEFFECMSDQGETEAPPTEGGRDVGKKAEGRLHPFNNTSLLNAAELLYVPVTQVREVHRVQSDVG